LPKKLTDLKEPVNLLYYGDGGTGKTTDLAAMANLGPILYVNAESGIKARALRKLGIKVENIEVYPDHEAGEAISFDGLEAEWKRLLAALTKNPKSYVGVVWDSSTEIHKALLDDIVISSVARADRAGKERDRFFIDLKDYGIMTEQVRNLMRKYRDLPCHFGVSALMRREQDDDGAVTYQPAITPKLQNDLIGWMDIVCVTSVAQMNDGGDDEYRGLFRPHSKYRGKDRLHALPKWLIDPYFDRVVSYVEEKVSVEKDPVMLAARKRHDAAKEPDSVKHDSAKTESEA
jgi:AAA domain